MKLFQNNENYYYFLKTS